MIKNKSFLHINKLVFELNQINNQLKEYSASIKNADWKKICDVKFRL